MDAVGPVEQALAGVVEPCLFVGDGARLYRDRITAVLGERARFAGSGLDLIRASTVAELARRGFGRHQAVEAGRLVPRYVRRSEAEAGGRLRSLQPSRGVACDAVVIDKV
jgi:tRNA threonylcarbamoyladenosine biosynthesis protein TsaB